MNLNDIPYMILVPGNNLLRQVWNKLLSPCYKVDDGSRLDTSCSNKTTVIQAVCFYELIVTNVLTTVRRYQTCWNNLLRACCPHQPCYKMRTTCSRLVTNWEQSSSRTHLVDKLWGYYASSGRLVASTFYIYTHSRIFCQDELRTHKQVG